MTDGESPTVRQIEDDRPTLSVAGRRISVARAAKLVALVVMVLLPFVIGSFYTGFLVQALIFAIFALGVDIIWGYSGVMTFGHAAFFGLGAYTMAMVTKGTALGGVAIYLGLGLAIVLPAIVALIIAGTLFYEEIDEMHFTIITLAIAIIAEQTAISWRGVTGGYDGLIGIPPLQLGVPGIAMASLSGPTLYYVVLLVTVGVYLLGRRIVMSPFGTALVAIKDNEEKARALGYKTEKYKTYAFVIGSAVAGFAGGLYAPYSGFVSPTLLGFVLSTNVLLWILIGGRGTLVGPLIGAVFLALFENVISGAFAFSWTLILGVVLVVIVLLFPEGVIGLLEIAQRRIECRLKD